MINLLNAVGQAETAKASFHFPAPVESMRCPDQFGVAAAAKGSGAGGVAVRPNLKPGRESGGFLRKISPRHPARRVNLSPVVKLSVIFANSPLLSRVAYALLHIRGVMFVESDFRCGDVWHGNKDRTAYRLFHPTRVSTNLDSQKQLDPTRRLSPG
jgi:hypothetical protein